MDAVKAIARRLCRYLVAAATLLFSRRRRSGDGEEEGLRERRTSPSRPAELAVVTLLLLAALAAAGFVAAYIAKADTQVLGLGIGLALICLAAAAIVTGKAVVLQEEREEQRPEFAHPDAGHTEGAELAVTFRAGGEGISRRRLLGAAAGVAGTALGAAVIVPLASLGPAVDDRLRASPWERGIRLVDENGLAVPAADLSAGSFLTAFAEGVDHEELAASVVVVRVDPRDLELPPERASWAPSGILAFSKVCTHAGCAVNLFRKPLYPPQQPGPALVCPCHYSTFDVLRAGEVVFGPAGRPLPQLPLSIDADGNLVAAGPLSGNVGPAWSGVRES